MSTRGAIAALLEREGYGVVAESIWVGREPSSTVYPSLVVSVYDGVPVETYGATEQQPYLQVYITGRPGEDEECEALADRVWQTLADVGPFTLDGTAINMVRPTTVPLDLGSDSSDRPERSINLEVTHD